MSDSILILPILLPLVGSLLVFVTPSQNRILRSAFALLFSGAALVTTIITFGKQLSFSTASWAGFGMDFQLKLDGLSGFIMVVAGFTFLALLYSVAFMQGRERERQFFGFVLLGSAFVTGSMLANNLVLMLFFWEGLLAVLFALIMSGGAKATPTATKALVISVTADFCLILGVGVVFWQSGSLNMSVINLPLDNFWNGFAYVMMMIGAVARAGAMPFHTWIPDAAVDAPLPFMAFLPAALDKLAGIYLLARLNLQLFQMLPGSGLSLTVMTLGCCTIIFAVLMALIQKDYKRLLSYHAISQVGYMILGIGTALPIGIVGGLFHMVNHALYKSCLFYSAGAVERQAGTTDLSQLGGLGRKMPVTFICFLLAAAAISGVPPLNGFFSKELVFDAALQINVVFYIVAALGAFFTMASFLKLAHVAWFGKMTQVAQKAKEAPWPMLVPLVVLAFFCVLFGVYNPLPLHGLVEPTLGSALTHSFAGLPHNWLVAGISVAVLLLAVANHYYGVKRSGSALGSSDHIHYAPVLKPVLAAAEAGKTDPYNLAGAVMDVFALVLATIDKAIDWFYMKLVTGIAAALGRGLENAHTEKPWHYVLWVLVGGVAVTVLFFVGIGG
ncbi:MAG: NADH-quinone oxidoreductase subunit L [Coriobacteriia bacterium]|nr:NADH-quinone oxidoreductase subunit L [Coriobacteriia bacterium]